MEKVLPLFKSSYSLSKSILTYEKAGKSKKGHADSIVDICLENGIKKCYAVEDQLGGYLEALENLTASGIDLILGWRVNFKNNAADNEDTNFHKNIIFTGQKTWKEFLKLHNHVTRNFTGKQGPCLDYKILKEFWNDKFVLGVPHYDSYLFNNLFTKSSCCPDFGHIKPIYFLENNDLPFDFILRDKLRDLEKKEGIRVREAKSIFYKERKDFAAWQVLKLSNRKGYGSGNTLEKPNLNYCGSTNFCVEDWKEQN